MPLYDYKCSECGQREERFNCMANHTNGPICCDKTMNQVYGSYYVHSDLKPYVDHNMSAKPIHVKSKKHRKQLMHENNVSEIVGKGWV